ncbi:hypothetical protein M899_1039 [Bacteriovorax sp. BSW11_IV]|nr:hypothetical protein M899_1039 [Bacteriovorax sp. BSW11_IV]
MEQRDSNGQLWARKLGRSQVVDFVQFSAKGDGKTSEKAWLSAKGKALSDLVSECGSIPEETKLFESCQDENYQSYVRYSVSKKDCDSKKEIENKNLRALLEQYKTEVLFSSDCIKQSNECVNKADILIKDGRSQDAELLLTKACEEGKSKACFYLSKLKIDSNFELSQSFFVKACHIVGKLKCFENTIQYKNKKTHYENILKNLCDIGNGYSCDQLIDVGSNMDKKDLLIKGCTGGAKVACKKLAKMNLTSSEIKVFSSDFCKSGIDSYCPKKNKDKYDLMENLEDEEISIKPLEI